MAKEKYILTKDGQKHSYDSLVTIMEGLDEQQIKELIVILGLDHIIDIDGGIAPEYSADIISSEDRFLNPNVEHNITLTGRLYNYFKDASDKVISWEWTRDSGDPITDGIWIRNSREIRIDDTDLTERVNERKVIFKLKAKVGEEIFEDEIDFSTVVTLNSVQIRQSHSLFLGGDPAEITLTAETTGVRVDNYKWFVNDVLKNTARTFKLQSNVVPNGSTVNIRLEVIDTKGILHSDFVSIPKLSNGTNGEPGVPGPPGEDGQAKYTWIKYADDDQGTNMSEYPTNVDGSFREYMGISSNKTSPVESNDYRDYTWSKYIGEDGVPGENGYMWVVYSQYPEGINHQNEVKVHNDPYDETVDEYMVYLGLAYNKSVKEEPDFNSMSMTEFKDQGFLWSKIKGEDGHTGYTLDSDNDMIALPADSDGSVIGVLSGNRANFKLFYGNTEISLKDMYTEFEVSGGVQFNSSRDGNETENSEWIEVLGMRDDTGSVALVVYSDSEANNELARTSVQIAKFKNLPVFNIVASSNTINVVPGIGNSADIISPNSLVVTVSKNTGSTIEDTTEGILTYKYNFQSGDGQAVTPDNEGVYRIPVSNAGNPRSIILQYFHPIMNNKVVDRETIPFVRDGKQGNPGEDGPQGPQGPPGIPGVPGSRGPMARMLEWRQGYTYYRNAEYRDYIYYRSDNATYEGWYCVREAAGNLYNTTAEGVKEYKAIANSGSPDTAKFQKQDFTDSKVFGTIIAENANLAGFIFRNQQLFSQAGMEQVTNPTYSNLLLNGVSGFLKFAEKLHIDKNGITFFDKNKKPRIRFGFEDTDTGVPFLRFLKEDGTILWEAGKEYTQWITQGTTVPSWRGVGMKLISELPENETFTDFTKLSALKNILFQVLSYSPNSNDPIFMPPIGDIQDDLYFINQAMPDNADYNSVGNIWGGKAYLLNKGDIAVNNDLYEGLYRTKTSVRNNQVPSDLLIKDGWHIDTEGSGTNGSMLMAWITPEGNYQDFKVSIYYYKNGKITNSLDITVARKQLM